MNKDGASIQDFFIYLVGPNGEMMKKRGKIIIVSLLVFLLIFVLPGLFVKKIRFSTSTGIKKPLSSVFITFGDPARLSQWMSGFEKIDHLQGMPFCEGSKYRLTLNIDGRRFTVVEEIIKITWKKHLIVDMTSEKADILMDLYFFRLGEQTMIEGTYEVKANNLSTRILLPWIKPLIRKKIGEELEQFREMMEKS